MNLLLASHRVGQIFGIEIHIAYSLYIIMGIFILQSTGAGIYGIISMLMLPVCVLAHELGHSLASKRFGVRVNRIVLHMLGGAAEIGSLIPGPRAEIIISIMGPAVSLIIAAVSYYLLLLTINTPAALLFYYLMYMNGFLAIFNLLPVFPMDGGRIALAIAMLLKGPEKALKLVKPLSIAGVVILCAYGLLQIAGGNQSGIMLILIGVLVYFQGNQELQARMYAARYSSLNDSWRNSYTSAPHKDATFTRKSKAKPAKPKQDSILESWKKKRQEARAAKNNKRRTELDDRVDEVLKKVKKEGIANLTPGEKAILQSAGKKYRSIFKK